MKDKLTAKQEKFAHNVAILRMSQHDAYIDAYNTGKMKPATIDRCAHDLVVNPKIATRIEEKRNQLEGPDIMTQREVLARLTSIGRATMADFATCSADGVWMPDYGPESLNHQAIKQIQTTTMPYKEGEDGAKVLLTKIELNDPMAAMRDICKIKGYWSQPEGNVTNNNLVINEAKIVHIDTAEVLRTITEAAKLGISPEILGGNGHGKDTALLPAQTDIQTTPIPESKN